VLGDGLGGERGEVVFSHGLEDQKGSLWRKLPERGGGESVMGRNRRKETIGKLRRKEVPGGGIQISQKERRVKLGENSKQGHQTRTRFKG